MSARSVRPPAPGILLDREAFAAAVLARSGDRCVLCPAPAADAHHILDRKLWSDGGYYLANGAAVCARCHWRCETTEVGVEEVRRATGINQVLVPPGFTSGDELDKWGNRVRPDGMRAWGPLEMDAGARRALAAGGFLGLMLPAGTLG